MEVVLVRKKKTKLVESATKIHFSDRFYHTCTGENIPAMTPVEYHVIQAKSISLYLQWRIHEGVGGGSKPPMTGPLIVFSVTFITVYSVLYVI